MIDRPRAKGGWIEPPAAKRRADFSACWDEREAAFGGLAVSVGGLWFCSGRLDKKINVFLPMCLIAGKLLRNVFWGV